MVNKLEIAAGALRWSGGGTILRQTPVWQGILTLNYHRIGDPTATPLDRDVFSASQDGFAAQVAFLKREFDVITPHQLPDALATGRGRYVMITFDDGYRDNFELALPVLRAHGVPATFFICTGYIDEPRLPWWDEIALMIRSSTKRPVHMAQWFDAPLPASDPDRDDAIRAALRRYKSLPAGKTGSFLRDLAIATGFDRASAPSGEELWMTWQMVRGLRDAGMTIGAHTIRHQLLSRLSSAEQAAEIAGSRDRIAEQIGSYPRAFAYPVGSREAFGKETKSHLRDHGFTSGFSFYGGLQRFEDFDPYDIRRAHIGHTATQPMFEAMTTLPSLFARW